MKKLLILLLSVMLIVTCVLITSCGGDDDTNECMHRYMPHRTIKEPTCEKEGSQIVKCTKCGDEETETIEKAGHNFQDGECTVCGEKE